MNSNQMKDESDGIKLQFEKKEEIGSFGNFRDYIEKVYKEYYPSSSLSTIVAPKNNFDTSF